MSQENITETILPSGFEITARQLSEMESVDFLLIDIRSQSSAAYGTIPGAVLIPQSQLLAYAHKISQNEDAVSDETDAPGAFSAAKVPRNCGIWALTPSA